jgi:hypothetical protein
MAKLSGGAAELAGGDKMGGSMLWRSRNKTIL